MSKELWCHMGYDVSHHLGAPWYCNHITVVPLLPSVVYRNCKQRGICDLVFWILRDTALLTLRKNRLSLHISVRLSSWKHGCTAGGNLAALTYSTLTLQKYFTYLKTTVYLSDVSHCTDISFKNTYLALFCLSVLRRKHSLKYSLHIQINNT